jgi:hypothetical protein
VADRDEDDDDIDTTMVRRGKEAFLLAEMGRFAKDLQTRPLRKLLADLPGLMELPDGKYALVAMAVAKRMRSEEERSYIEDQLQSLRTQGNDLVRERCDALLKPSV